MGVLFVGFCFISGCLESIMLCYLFPWFYSAGVFPGKVCWCWRLGYCDEVVDGRLEEKIFVIFWGIGSELKGRLQIFCCRAGDKIGY